VTKNAGPETPLDRVATALQDFVNEIDDQAPVLLRGAVVAWESMIFDEDGDAMFKVNYAALPNTSMASTIGILDLANDVAKHDMFADPEEH
jgi:hypothetical protein